MSEATPTGPWVVMREGRARRWGGELRRYHIFNGLAARTGARIVDGGWYPVLLRRAVRGPLGFLPGPLLHRLPHLGPVPKLAAAEKLRDRLLAAARDVTDPAVVAIYDDPVAQARALGVELEPGWLAEARRRQRHNLDTFRWHVVPTASFAQLVGLDMDRVIVGGNGTDVTEIEPGPWPSRPAVGVMSGAAPGRGLELLVDAVRIARTAVSDLELHMWLVATGEESERYLDGLRRANRSRPWVTIDTAPYEQLSDVLAASSALCIAHPPGEYMDAALPVKLFDSLAAGRPVIVTPRRETVAVTEGQGVGVVAPGETADDFAGAIVGLLSDEARLRSMGARAREVAVEQFDWPVVGGRIADAVLEREASR